jgi:predicted S18 family serine protease
MVARKRKVTKALFVVAIILIIVSVALAVFSAAGVYEPVQAACEGVDCVASSDSAGGQVSFAVAGSSGGSG